ncbi:uncharacterized protein LOC118229153 [Anguilla anguilla]|uniref:uncharacterized protein LOC118229153 n=1 Tax=Anguilla anguilla TaxID=7936 RepID=UPI0015AC609D|nr:uncharacterized protein LOC118229153 [Anguilla anguilla]
MRPNTVVPVTTMHSFSLSDYTMVIAQFLSLMVQQFCSQLQCSSYVVLSSEIQHSFALSYCTALLSFRLKYSTAVLSMTAEHSCSLWYYSTVMIQHSYSLWFYSTVMIQHSYSLWFYSTVMIQHSYSLVLQHSYDTAQLLSLVLQHSYDTAQLLSLVLQHSYDTAQLLSLVLQHSYSPCNGATLVQYVLSGYLVHVRTTRLQLCEFWYGTVTFSVMLRNIRLASLAFSEHRTCSTGVHTRTHAHTHTHTHTYTHTRTLTHTQHCDSSIRHSHCFHTDGHYLNFTYYLYRYCYYCSYSFRFLSKNSWYLSVWEFLCLVFFCFVFKSSQIAAGGGITCKFCSSNVSLSFP